MNVCIDKTRLVFGHGGGEGVEVGHDEETVVLILESNPIFESTDIVAQMKQAGGPVASEDTWFSCRHR